MKSIKITDIVPAEYNPRIMSEEEFIKLGNSIGEFGLVDPIIINLKNNKIIGGHQRYDVLLNQYMDNKLNENLCLIELGDIGWCFPNEDLKIKSEEHEKALNLALNKISGDWDFEKVNIILDGLEDVGFDVSLTGFDVIGDNSLEVDDFDENEFLFEEGKEQINDVTSKEELGSEETDTNEIVKGKVIFKIQIDFSDENQQREYYDILTEEGYDCQILTL